MSDLTKQSELKNCPFCGSAPRVTTTGVWWVVCDECACEGPVADSEAEAIAIWNTRPASAGVREALEGALKFIEGEMKFSPASFDGGEEPFDQFTYDAVPVAMALRTALSDHGVQKSAGVEGAGGEA